MAALLNASMTMIGQYISHYKILEKVGEGGMGVVYKAQDTKLDRLVALKFLPKHLSSSDQDKARFIQEAKAASALDHPNICTIYGIEETVDGQLFMVMAYYDGETLHQKTDNRPLSIEDCIAYSIQIAAGLKAAHNKGVTHRDIKGSNIMVTSEGQIKIMDFGLARTAADTMLTKTGTTVGTVPYMSPEQARGEKIDHRTDIWSFGVVMYEMITGRLPFQSAYSEAIVYSILNENPTPCSSLRAEVPNAFDRVVNTCLQKKPEDRYRSADEIITELKGSPDTSQTFWHSHAATNVRLKSQRVLFGAIAVVVGALIWLLLLPPSSPLGPEHMSIAVLPFTNMSDSKEDEYFSDGVTDEIITHLSRIGVFKKVISRTSTMLYKTKQKDLAEIRKSLDVGLVVEGTVRRAGPRVRINAQLVDTRTSENLWVNTYDRELTDILEIQENIARDITKALHAALSQEQERSLAQRAIENIDAYNFYLIGNFNYNKATPQGFALAEQYYQRALTLEPTAAIIHARLVELYCIMPWFGFLSPEEATEKAKPHLAQAVEFDNGVAEVQTAVALYKSFYQWNWNEAEPAYRRALNLNPNSSAANFWYGQFLTIVRNELAEQHWHRLVEIDPLSILNRGEVGWMYYMTRHFDKSIEALQEAVQLDSSWFDSYHHLGCAYVQVGRYEKAIAMHEKAVRLVGGSDVTRAGLGFAYAVAGYPEKARQIVSELIRESEKRYVPSYQIAIVWTGLGEKELAFQWLSKGIKEHDVWIPVLKIEPAFDPLRSDPRYELLLKEMGLSK